MTKPLLEIRGLVTAFHTDEGLLRAVDDVSFSVPLGSTVGVVGESGCGKTVCLLSTLRLIDSPPGEIQAGEVLFEGRDLLRLSPRELRRIRGNAIAMIFQEPSTSLNPVYPIGKQIAESLRLHLAMRGKAARERAIELLDRVGIPAPRARVDDYPHQLSGGMRQRTMIAMALACSPKLLIADEPTTALDVTIQAQILELLAELQQDLGMSVVLITHDLGIVANQTRSIVVMYAGRVVEIAPAEALFAEPLHPYTRGLLASLPSRAMLGAGRRRLPTIPGVVPDLREPFSGCRFRERCPSALARCAEDDPSLLHEGERAVACFAVKSGPGR